MILTRSDAQQGRPIKVVHNPPAPAAPPPQEHPAQALWKQFFAGEFGPVAEACWQRTSDVSEYLHIMGLALVKMGKVDDGVQRLRAATHLPPAHPQRFANAAIALSEKQQHALALEFGKEGVARHPQDCNMHFVYGNALLNSEKWQEAADEYNAALRIDPQHNDSLLNLGNCNRRLNDFEASQRCYEEVIRRDPKRQDAMINLASLHLTFARTEEADALLDQCRAIGSHAIADFMKSLILLGRGEYIDGWALYRRRHETPMAEPERKQWRKPVPNTIDEWRGKTVLILHEQGYGDSLQFCRYIPMAAEVAGKTYVLAPKPLHRLFMASFPGVTLVERREDCEVEYEIPMLDLPNHFKTTLETIPNSLPYFKVPDEAKVRILPPRNAERPVRVGLVWAGQARPDPTLREIDGRRSTTLETFGALSKVDGIEFVSLQLGEPEKQLATPPEGMTVYRVIDGTYDFAATGGIIQQLDLVIAVDTSVAHLTGGLKVPIWILSRYDGCWRWLQQRPDSPWYPEVARVFGQKSPGDWAGLMENEVVPALAEFVSARKSQLNVE